MKYRNASEVLPEALLKEIQKYVSGETLYIPTKEERVGWGESSGAKAFYTKRNEEIREKYYNRFSLEDLADEYGLSVETIRKIIYK